MRLLLAIALGSCAFAQTVWNGGPTIMGQFDASGATLTRPIQNGTTDPATCTAGKDLFLNTTGTPTIRYCISTNTWEVLASSTVSLPLSNKTLITPAIADFTNATHSHTNAAGGGQIVEGSINFTDITTGNVSITKHGFVPKLPNDATKYLDGTGAFTIPPGGGGAGNVTWKVSGTATGPARAIVNFTLGSGISLAGSDNGTDTAQIQISPDTAVLLTKATYQSGASNTVTTTSASGTTYTGTMNPTLTAYAKDQVLTWDVGATGCTAGAVTINIDALGAKSLKEADGTTNPLSTDCTANQIVRIAYDGTLFRIVGGGAPAALATPVSVPNGGTNLTTPWARNFYYEAAGCNNATASSAYDLPTSAAAAAACVTGTNVQKGVLQYVSTAATVNSAQFTIKCPVGTTGTQDFNIYWTTTATTGNMKWFVGTASTATNAAATDDPAFTDSTVTTAAAGTASRVQKSAVTGVSACTSDTLLHVRIKRDTNDAADTVGATVNLIGVEGVIRVTPQS